MDAPTAVAKLHELDPAFRQICDSLFPGFEPRQIADSVYKSEPDQADTHVPTTQWRNGRGRTRGRGRRKIDTAVLDTRFVNKGLNPIKNIQSDVAGVKSDLPGSGGGGVSANTPGPGRMAHAVGLGTTAVGAGISAVALPKHLAKIPSAIKNAKTEGPSVGTGIKNAVSAVRSFTPAVKTGEEAPGAVKTGLGALKAGTSALRENPKIGAGLLVGAAALHTANLGGEFTATHVLRQQNKKFKTPSVPTAPIQQTSLTKAWQQAQTEIIAAYQQGVISKAEALSLGNQVHTELTKNRKPVNTDDPYTRTLGKKQTRFTSEKLSQHAGGSGPTTPVPRGVQTAVTKDGGFQGLTATKLTALKAPSPITADQPKLTPSTIEVPKGGKSGAGRKAGKPKAGGGKKRSLAKSLDVEGEIAKADEDKMQCFGWCSVVKLDGKDVIDKQNDLIDIEDVEDSAYDYVLNSRAGGDMHNRDPFGGVDQKATMIESMVFTPEKIAKMGLPDDFPHGWWIGLQVHDEDLWDDVKSGRKRKFSIHGSGQRTEVLVDD